MEKNPLTCSFCCKFVAISCIIASHVSSLLAQTAEPPAQNAESAAPTTPPFANIQILNGVSPISISLSLNGQPLYTNLTPGARIPSFGVKDKELKLTVSKAGTEEKKEFSLSFPKSGYYTLVLAGDFSPLKAAKSAEGENIPDYNVKTHLLTNEKPDGRTVSLRVVNSLPNEIITITRDKTVQIKVAPGESGVAQSQPAELYVKALAGDESVDLYLAQSLPAPHITAVFWPREKGFGFKAMTETFGVLVAGKQ